MSLACVVPLQVVHMSACCTKVAELVSLQQEGTQCHTGKHDQGSVDEQGPSKKARTGIPNIQVCKSCDSGKMVFPSSHVTSFLLCWNLASYVRMLILTTSLSHNFCFVMYITFARSFGQHIKFGDAKTHSSLNAF